MTERKYAYLGGTELKCAEKELDDLIDRLQRIEGFISSGQDEPLAPACRSLLECQRDAMRIYARVLDERIEQFLKYE